MATSARLALAAFASAFLACTSGGASPEPTPTECTPAASEACYSGPAGTAGVGACLQGTRTCSGAGTWGPCQGEVVPALDACGNGLDEDCDGSADDSADEDGDGYTACDGDCCDVPGACSAPEQVNPGAFEVAGDAVDDDCDGSVVAAPSCDAGLALDGAGADLARALGLCRTLVAGARGWGVTDARLHLADGAGSPAATQHGLPTAFGQTLPREGAAMLALSTGAARAPGQPGYSAFQDGTVVGTEAPAPAGWLAANGGSIPTAPGCPPAASTVARDSIAAQVTVRVPTNARSFTVRVNQFSSEFPEWVCSAYADVGLVLLSSQHAELPANPADGNVAAHGAGVPLGSGLAALDAGYFGQCRNGATGCGTGATPRTLSTCAGTGELAGTGFELAAAGCEPGDSVGGATGWLRASGNVVPGETITLRFVLFDVGDGLFDSVLLADGFEWSTEPVTPGLAP